MWENGIVFCDSSTVMIIGVIKVVQDSFQDHNHNNLTAKPKNVYLGQLQLYYQYQGTKDLHFLGNPALPAARIIRMLHAYYNTNPSKASVLYVCICNMRRALWFLNYGPESEL